MLAKGTGSDGNCGADIVSHVLPTSIWCSVRLRNNPLLVAIDCRVHASRNGNLRASVDSVVRKFCEHCPSTPCPHHSSSRLLREPLRCVYSFMVVLPHLLRRKLKPLTDPSSLTNFPFVTSLREYPTSYISEKHSSLPVSRRMMMKRNSSSRQVLETAIDESLETNEVASAPEDGMSRKPFDDHTFEHINLESAAARSGTRCVRAHVRARTAMVAYRASV